MVQREISDFDPIAATVRGKNICLGRGHVRRLIETRPKVAAAKLVLAVNPVNLYHPLIVVLYDRRARESQLPPGTVGKRNTFQKELSRRAEHRCRDLVAGKGLSRRRVDKLRRDIREIAIPLRRGRNKGDLPLGGASDASSL